MLIKQTTAYKIIHFTSFQVMFVYVHVTFCFKYSARELTHLANKKVFQIRVAYMSEL